MHHPFVYHYIANTTWGLFGAVKGQETQHVLKVIERFLRDSRYLMSLQWSGLSEWLEAHPISSNPYNPSTIRLAYKEGWGFSEETKQLRKFFEGVLSYQHKEINLEDYM